VFSDEHSQSGKSVGGQSYYALQKEAFTS